MKFILWTFFWFLRPLELMAYWKDGFDGLMRIKTVSSLTGEKYSDGVWIVGTTIEFVAWIYLYIRFVQ